MKNNKGIKAVRNVAIGGVLLLVLMVGAGAGYTWYNGTYGEVAESAIAKPVESKFVRKEIKPTPQAADAKASAAVISVTSPVVRGANATLDVRTNPGAKCKVSVVYGSQASTDSGLEDKVADEYGMVSWTWTVGKSVPLGKWPAEATCAIRDQSAFVRGEFQVVEKEVPVE